MITIYFGDKPYQYPNQWDELTDKQYLALVSLWSQFWNGEISLCDLRVRWFKKIAGLERLKVEAKHLQRVADNIYTASRQFNFFFELDYDGQIDGLSSQVQKLLRKTPAEDIYSSDAEIRYAEKLEYRYKPDAVWMKNLLPTISVGYRLLSGWDVSLNGGALTSSLTARQFLQGCDILSMIGKYKRRADMALLASVLYPAEGEALPAALYERLPDNTLAGIILNFQALVQFLFTRTHYSILWNRSDSRDAAPQITSYMSDRLYSLSGLGYGDYDKVGAMPLLTYLSILREKLISDIQGLHRSKVKIDEIAERMNMPIDIIQKII